MRAQGADYGIALDGDADRLLMVDAPGALYNGDELLYVMACRPRCAQGQAVPGVVGTLMTNMAVELALRRARRRASCAPRSATATCSRSCSERGWQLGGEGSGHLLCLDKHTTGDGIVSALQVLQAVRRDSRQPGRAAGGRARCIPQTLINVRVAGASTGRANAASRPGTDGGRSRELGERGRVLIRASGTEPVLRVMVEGDDEAEQWPRSPRSWRRGAGAGRRLTRCRTARARPW